LATCVSKAPPDIAWQTPLPRNAPSCRFASRILPILEQADRKLTATEIRDRWSAIPLPSANVHPTDIFAGFAQLFTLKG
jgi:hypothetical protein